MGSDGQADEVERLRRRLLRDASLFDDPSSYAAGVQDAIDAVVALDRAETDREALTSSGTGS